MRIAPKMATKVFFAALQNVPEYKNDGAMKISALKPAYTKIGQELFSDYDRYSHEHCLDYVASHAFT